jgi:flavodoxin
MYYYLSSELCVAITPYAHRKTIFYLSEPYLSTTLYQGGTDMKSLIVYSSASPNTKQLAQGLYDHLSGEKTFCSISKAPDPAGYNFVAVGFWLQKDVPDQETQAFLAKLEESQDTYLFASHEADTSSPYVVRGMKAARDIAKKAHIIQTFSCSAKASDTATVDTQDVNRVVRMLEGMDLP